MTFIVIINYSVGNLLSVKRGLEKAGAKVAISSEPEEIRGSDGVILPGVGAFAEAKKNLSSLEEIVVQ
ncbi:MAG: imidazole glycerol phosphate synthase subunit HisH, partial [Candidatus Bathyarchaeia archaeon]